MSEITSVAQLEALHQRYPHAGTVALATDGKSMTFWSYDDQGNELRETLQAGEKIQYTETPGVQRKVLVWNDETARYEHR